MKLIMPRGSPTRVALNGVALLFVLALLASCSSPAPAPTAPAKTTAPAQTTASKPVPASSSVAASTIAPKSLKLRFAASDVASTTYAYYAAMGKTITDNVPEVASVTLSSVGGAFAATKAVLTQGYDLTGQMGVGPAFEAYNGVAPNFDKKYPETRVLFGSNVNSFLIYVRADTGIKSIKELAGKKFSAGNPGSSSALGAEAAIKAAGIEVDWFKGSASDATAAMKDRRIVGMASTGEATISDAKVIDVLSSIPLRVLPFTDAELQAACKVSYYVKTYMPPGAIKEFPDLGGFYYPSSVNLAGATTRLPQTVVYGIVKACLENWKDLGLSYPPAARFDPIKGTLDVLAGYGGAPMHAGLVKYLEEKGVKVPQDLIPPEYNK